MPARDFIKVYIPEWAKDRNIYVMAGIELLAYRLRGGKLMTKVSRCNMCGECCADLDDSHPFPVINGQCAFLTKQGDQWLCGLGVFRPHQCCITFRREEWCSEKYEEQK